MPYSGLQKIGVILRGLATGIGIAVLTSAALFVFGLALSLMGNAGWIHLGEDQPWMPLIGLIYGFPIGLIIGGVVCGRFCKSRLGRATPGEI